jgi:single-strand DNA-binding protein
MASLNKVTLMGNLGAAPELKYTQNGQPVAEMRVATSRSWKKDDEWQEETEWHTVVAWGEQAERCAQNLEKGMRVYVEGRVKTRTWDDKEGQRHYKTEIISEQVIFIDRKEQPRE